MESTMYTVDGKSFELRHYGVKGMKWGRRKARPEAVGAGRRTAQVDNSPEAQAARREARRQKVKRAAMIGAAVAGTALAAYGTYKVAQYMQNKRNLAAYEKAQSYVEKNILRKVGESVYRDGTRTMRFENYDGSRKSVHQGARNQVGKAIGQHNAKVIAEGRQMYRDATNTRLDRGLAKVVNTGNAVGNATKRAGANASHAVKSASGKARTAATKAKNAVLDTVNPIYDYNPGAVRTKTWTDSAGMKWTEKTQYYDRVKRKRR